MNKKLVVLIMGLIVLTALFLRIRSSLPVLRVEGENFHWEDFSKIKNDRSRSASPYGASIVRWRRALLPESARRD